MHAYVDNHHQILLLIKTPTTIFGGYLSPTYKGKHNDWISDNLGLSFLFNLTKRRRFPLKYKHRAARYMDGSYRLGNVDLVILGKQWWDKYDGHGGYVFFGGYNQSFSYD